MAGVILEGKTFGADPERALDAYELTFADMKIDLIGEPRLVDPGDSGAEPLVALEVDSNSMDEAFWAISKTQDRLRTSTPHGSELQIAPSAAPTRPTIVVNMFGGPGAGKSTAALEVAEKLKKAGYVVDYASEFAKDLVWDMHDPKATAEQRAYAAEMLSGRYDNQMAVYAEQLRRVRRGIGQCDFVVTDSPILLSAAYLKEDYPSQRDWFETMALRDFNSMENFNMVVKRAGAYEREGRVQTPDEAAAIDDSVTSFLDAHDIYYGTYDHGQIDKAIQNMRATHDRILRVRELQERTRAELAARLEARYQGNETAKEAVSSERAQSARKGALNDMAEQTTNQREYVHVSVPKTGYQGKDLIRQFTGKDGQAWAQVKMPPHTPEMTNVNGDMVDVSNRTMLVYGGEPKAVKASNGSLGVRTGSITAWDNDPNYVDVNFPKTNKAGEPWNVELRLEQGHWENPGAQGAERGQWIQDEPIVDRVNVEELQAAMQYYRSDKQDYAREQNARSQRQTQEKAQSAPAQDAQEAPAQEPEPRHAEVLTPEMADKAMEQGAKAAAKPKPKRSTPGPDRTAKHASPAADAKAASASAKAQAATRKAPVQTKVQAQ